MRSLLSTLLALAFLLLSVLTLFRNALVDGLVYFRSDTFTYYFPIANRLVDVLRDGQLMLWTRYIFGGFPLFADGEAGMLYPPNLIAYLLLPEEEAFIWLRVVRYLLAALFTYGYLRVLRLNGFAATIGALSFSLGSFMITQMHHTNVGNTAIWLPLALCMIELAVRSVRRWRWIHATLAGAVVGIQALGLHIQPLLISGFFLAAYIPFRVMLCPIAWPPPRERARPAAATRPLASSRGVLSSAGSMGLARAPRGAASRIRNSASRLAHRLRPLAARLRGALGAGWEQVAGADLAGLIRPPKKAVVTPDVPPEEPALSRETPVLSADSTVDRRPQRGAPAATPPRRESRGRIPLRERVRAMVPVSLGRGLEATGDGERRPPSAPDTGSSGQPTPAMHLLEPVLRRLLRLVVGTFHRTVLAILLLGMVPAIALGIAAVQVIPLVELGFFSFRGLGVNYQFATSYSMPVHNLVNLVFPYFFRYTNRFYWSLWSEWETTLYAGIAPLALAIVALLFVRNRMVLFFAAVTVASLLLAFGGQSPYPLYERLWQLPGFSSLRVPGRFSMLVTFSIAVLSAYGANWLCESLRPLEAGRPLGRWRRLSRSVAVNGFALYLLGLLAAMAAVAWWLVSFRGWIEREPWAVKRLLEESYLSQRNDKPWLTSDMVLSFLNYSLDPTNEKTATSLALMLATFLLLFSWFAFRRLWRAWAALLVVLVAADMLMFATDFHPTVHISQLATPDAAARWLMAQNRDGMGRVYTPPGIRKTEPNKLMPFRVAEIAGYSSLETTRHQEYMINVAEYDKVLLDVYNVRFVVMPKRPPAMPSYQHTAYHPNRPLAWGPPNNRGAHATFYMSPAVRADAVCIISGLRSATEIPQDAEVAEIVVEDTSGERVALKVKAGRDTAEWAYDRPDVTPHVAHRRVQVADRIWVADKDGRQYQANLYFARLQLDKTRTVSKLEFHYLYPKGTVRLYGMALWENPNTAHQVLSRDKYLPRYEDDEVVILENLSRLPRAFLVPTARLVKRSEILDTMVQGDFDPERVVLLEPPEGRRAMPTTAAAIFDTRAIGTWLQASTGVADPNLVESWVRGNPVTRPGTAEIVKYESREVVIRTESDRNAILFLSDSYYPGWKAQVDGAEQRVYRANYLFRAVLVPSGRHEVRFVFEPESFILGAQVSAFSISTLLILWAILLPGPAVARGAWRAGRWIKGKLDAL